MNKKLKIFIFCMIVVGGSVNSQITLTHKSSLLPIMQTGFPSEPVFVHQLWKPSLIKPVIAPNHYSSHLGFFCQQEIKMDKALKIPLRFRLGSIEQCNWLEGKKR